MTEETALQPFKANTLKNLLKWIDNPNDRKLAETLQKNITTDQSRNTNRKKLTPAVKKHITTINQLSSPKKKIIRKIIKKPTNLSNEEFINNACDKTRHKKKHKTHNKMNHTNHIITALFEIQCANKLIEAFNTNVHQLQQLTSRISAYKQKLNVLNELKSNGNMSINTQMTQPIETELNNCISQENVYTFRAQILLKVITKIRKQQDKILNNKKCNTLQQILERIILSKHESKAKYALKMNTLNQMDERTKQELINICSNPNDLDMARLNTLKIEQNGIKEQKQTMNKSINDVQILLDGIKTLLNEIVYKQSIEHKVWLRLKQSHMGSLHTDNVTKVMSAPRVIQPQQTVESLPSTSVVAGVNINNINNGNNTTKKKHKFKRPTRSKAVKAKRITVCDILPKKLFPIKLSQTFLNNGNTQGMFDESSSAERAHWMKQYNMHQIPSMAKKFKSLYGNHIFFKPISNKRQRTNANINKNMGKIATAGSISKKRNIVPIEARVSRVIQQDIVTVDSMSKKRKIDELSTDDIPIDCVHKKQKIDHNDSEDSDCINELSDDDAMSVTNANQIVLSVPQSDIKENDNENENTNECVNRNNKQTLNRYKVFKAQNQKRQRGKTKQNNNDRNYRNKGNIDRNHPLFQNDPLIKRQRNNNTSGADICQYYVRMGICGYLTEGKCKFKHPKEFAAKNWFCPRYRNHGDCNRESCCYTHELSDIPCKDYYTSTCKRKVGDCYRSHEFTKEQYMIWNEARIYKITAWQQWEGNKRNKSNVNFENKDERLTSTTNDELFISALTE